MGTVKPCLGRTSRPAGGVNGSRMAGPRRPEGLPPAGGGLRSAAGIAGVSRPMLLFWKTLRGGNGSVCEGVDPLHKRSGGGGGVGVRV